MEKKRKQVRKDSDYNYIVVRVLLDMLERTNDELLSCQKAGITHKKFQSWCKNYPEFEEQVRESKETYMANTPLALQAAARRELLKYLKGDQKRTSRVEETYYDGGQVKGHKIIEKVENIETPRWVIERILGTEMSEIDALKVLADNDWLTPESVEDVSHHLSTLNEELRSILNEGFKKKDSQ